MATVHMICGFLGAGKTTFARRLAREVSAVRLSVDELYLELFSNGPTYQLDREAMDRLLSALGGVWPQVVGAGVDVVLDWGFWNRSLRDEVRQRAYELGAASRLHWVRCSEAVMLARCLERNGAADAFLISSEGFRELRAFFQPPEADEACEIIEG